MKKFILSILFIFTFDVFAHEPGEPIKVGCFITDISVGRMMPPYEVCFKDEHPEGFDEKKASSGLGCSAIVSVGYILGLHDLSELRKGVSFNSMKTVISFEDGQKFTSMSTFFNFNPTFNVGFTGEKMIRFYNREEPIDVQCVIL